MANSFTRIPGGEATSTPTQYTVLGRLKDIDDNTSGNATEAKQDDAITELQNIDAGKLEESTFTDRAGEKQETPSQYTLLRRIKDLLTGIILAAGSNLIGKVTIDPVVDTPEFFEDTDFLTGDSPVTLDINDALGRNATKGTIINDGPGDSTVSFSFNGSDFGDEITIQTQEQIDFSDISVDSIRITWAADSAYRVVVI